MMVAPNEVGMPVYAFEFNGIQIYTTIVKKGLVVEAGQVVIIELNTNIDTGMTNITIISTITTEDKERIDEEKRKNKGKGEKLVT